MKNNKFWGTSILILVTTYLIVQFGGEVFNTEPISTKEWLILIAITSPVVIVRELYHQLFGKKTQDKR
jgi:Ca2+-transporting ATPase